jgi:exosome complex RNA-binding protein Csl4
VSPTNRPTVIDHPDIRERPTEFDRMGVILSRCEDHLKSMAEAMRMVRDVYCAEVEARRAARRAAQALVPNPDWSNGREDPLST